MEILEIGCGTGGNLSMLSSLGKVTAIEMNAEAVEIVKEKNLDTVNVHIGSLPNGMPKLEKKFDLICLFDVVEHIEEDQEALKKIKKYLKENGKIIITVPAYQWLYGKHDEYLHHKRRYSKNEIIRVAENSGYNVKRITFFNTILFPLALIVRIYEKHIQKTNEKRGVKVEKKWINDIFKYIFEGEIRILNKINMPFGLSLLCVLSKA